MSVQPLFELKEGTLRGTVPAHLLKEVLEMCDILIYRLVTHHTVHQLPVGTLLGGCVGICTLKVVTELNPQSFIVSTVGQGDVIKHIPIAFSVESLCLLDDPIIDRRTPHKRQG